MSPLVVLSLLVLIACAAVSLTAASSSSNSGGPGDFMEATGPCNFTLFTQVYAAQLELVALLRTNSSDKADLLARQTQLWAFEQEPAWANCMGLVAGRFALWANVSRTHRLSRECRADFNSTAWNEDPCCNRVLEATQACCAPRDIDVTEMDVVGMNATALAAHCGDAERAFIVLEDLRARMGDQTRCDALSGDGIDMWTDLFEFRQTCQSEVFGDEGQAPACRTDVDCWSGDCDSDALTCVIPWHDPFTALVACYAATMDGEVYKRVLDHWQLADLSLNETAFRAEFGSRVSSDDCTGPRAWQHSGHWEGRPCTVEESASDPEHCRCWSANFNAAAGKSAVDIGSGGQNGTAKRAVHQEAPAPSAFAPSPSSGADGGGGGDVVCWSNVYVPGNESACLAEAGCNWQSWANETQCAQSNATEPAVCVQCWGANNCNRVGEKSECRAYVDALQCDALNGTLVDGWRCVFANLTTMATCIPENICQAAWQQKAANDAANTGSRGFWSQDYTCNERCVADAGSDNSTACAALQGEQGTASCVVRGYGNESTCLAADATATFLPPDDCVLGAAAANQSECAALPDFQQWPPPPEADLNGSTVAYWQWPRYVGTWFDAATGTCNANVWGKRDCESLGFTHVAGRTWHQGLLGNQTECEAGVCDVNPALNATQCAAAGWCDRGCPKCRSRTLQQGHGLCYIPGACPVSNATGVAVGTYKAAANACVLEARSADECALQSSLGAVAFESCEALTNLSVCSACEFNAPDCPVNQLLLQCWKNAYDQCTTADECEQSAGDCNDWQFVNYVEPSCMNRYARMAGENLDAAAAGEPWDCEGACLMPFDTAQGWLACPPAGDGSVQRSSIGCLSYAYRNASACEADGFVWKQRAHSEAACNAQSGDLCFQKQMWLYSEKNASACASCRGVMRDPFRWSGGTWHAGQMRAYTWQEKRWASVNAWGTSIDQQKLDQLFSTIGAQLFAEREANRFTCSQGPLLAALSKVVCDCAEEDALPSDTCYAAGGRLATGSAQFYPEIERSDALGTAVTLTFNGTSDGRVDVQTFVRDDMRLILANMTEQLAALTRKRSGAAAAAVPNAYAVVTNANGAIVGQLVALEPLDVEIVGVGSVEACVARDLDLPFAVLVYPVAHFAVYDEDANTLVPVADPLPTTSGGSAYIDYCVTLTASTTLYPVIVYADWATRVVATPPPPPPPAPPSTEPAPAEPAPAECPTVCAVTADCAACDGTHVRCGAHHACCEPDACVTTAARFAVCVPPGARDTCTGAALAHTACGYATCNAQCGTAHGSVCAVSGAACVCATTVETAVEATVVPAPVPAPPTAHAVKGARAWTTFSIVAIVAGSVALLLLLTACVVLLVRPAHYRRQRLRAARL